MEKNIVLAGVGGQGILSIAYVIDNAALDAGYQFKQAEVHGMAQRGGAVQSNLRYSDRPIHSDLIPRGKLDLILSVEPLEAMRYRGHLSREGWVVTSTTPFVNIPDYPEESLLFEKLSALGRVVMVDSRELAKAAGNLRAQNMVMVGAAACLLDFTDEQLIAHVRGLFARKGEKVMDANEKAFRLGRAVGAFFHGLVVAGVRPLTAHRLCGILEPTTVDPTHVGRWVEALTRDPAAVEALIAEGRRIPCDGSSTQAVA